MQDIIPIILCGGCGSRLWPYSRELNPKPFIRLPSGQSLFQLSLQRALKLATRHEVVVVVNRENFFLAHDQCNELNPQHQITFILEPVSRDTTAAVSAGAIYVSEQYGASVNTIVLAADHVIQQEAHFIECCLQDGLPLCKDKIVIFGIQPDSPCEAYGYIKYHHHQVIEFVEKPDSSTAQQFINSGNYLWNSGILLFNNQLFLAELDQHAPKIATAVKQSFHTAGHYQDSRFKQIILDLQAYEPIEKISIDYALLEKSNTLAVIKLENSGWSDVGSWDNFAEQFLECKQGNHVEGSVLLNHSHNCIVVSDRPITVVSHVQQLLVVAHDDALLIMDKSKTQEIKAIYQQVKQSGHLSYKTGSTVYRPWGHYTVFNQGKNYKVKQVVIHPKGVLSLQHHKFRSEHWIIVQGTAHVTKSEQQYVVNENESTYIARGQKHRVENRSNEELIMIEVQTGSYLEEDDIIRHEDIYNRL